MSAQFFVSSCQVIVPLLANRQHIFPKVLCDICAVAESRKSLCGVQSAFEALPLVQELFSGCFLKNFSSGSKWRVSVGIISSVSMMIYRVLVKCSQEFLPQ